MAISGGSTPTPVFAELARREVDWSRVVIIQVDERIVPLDSSSRNLMDQRTILGHLGSSWLPLPVDELLALRGGPPTTQDQPPVVDGGAAQAVLDQFVQQLLTLSDDPPVLDLVHLGLGADGHTASLVPGDPVVDELRSYVGLTGLYDGSPPTTTQADAALDTRSARPASQRLTLTRPVLDRARMVVWLVTGGDKAQALERLYRSDRSIPAGLVRPAHSVIVADPEAARLLSERPS